MNDVDMLTLRCLTFRKTYAVFHVYYMNGIAADNIKTVYTQPCTIQSRTFKGADRGVHYVDHTADIVQDAISRYSKQFQDAISRYCMQFQDAISRYSMQFQDAISRYYKQYRTQYLVSASDISLQQTKNGVSTLKYSILQHSSVYQQQFGATLYLRGQLLASSRRGCQRHASLLTIHRGPPSPMVEYLQSSNQHCFKTTSLAAFSTISLPLHPQTSSIPKQQHVSPSHRHP